MGLDALISRVKQLRCPLCKEGEMQLKNNNGSKELLCLKCGALFPIIDGYVKMLPAAEISRAKQKIQEFWGDTCLQWYSDFNKSLTPEIFYEYLDDMESMYKYHGWMAVNEMELNKITGLDILEIGCGGGAESSLLKRHGANMTSVDITPERTASTAFRLSLIKEGSFSVFQADAENLPFKDNSFDIVYSNGVLHHSENTERCVEEVYRVLKPNGKLVILLYSRHSVYHWLNLFPRTVFSGLIFRLPEAERLGVLTEGIPKYGTTKNPITRIYSEKEIRRLFSDFKVVSLRKGSFSFFHLPIPGRFNHALKKMFRFKCWKSGIIAFGDPYYADTFVEIALSKYFGFAWNIVAHKE
jgi:ubiquinone/menaquinone biosynthesis C-methylase UbiE/uncharacterized protein YbaR (Trm112 family)